MHSLSFARLVLSSAAVGTGRLAAVAGDGAARVELPEAGWVGAVSLVTPDGAALVVHERAAAVEAVAQAVLARDRVLDEEVGWAEAGEARAHLGKVALVGGVPTGVADRTELKGVGAINFVSKKSLSFLTTSK